MWFLIVLSLTGDIVQHEGPMTERACKKRIEKFEGALKTTYKLACIHSLKGGEYEFRDKDRVRHGKTDDRSGRGF